MTCKAQAAEEAALRLEDPQHLYAQLVKEAEAGDPRAQEKLGNFYQRAHSNDTNKSNLLQSEHWLTKAAEAGLPTAMTSLGHLFIRSQDKKKTKMGVAWLEKAAATGFAVAQNELGRVLQEGRPGVEADPTRAAELFKQAAAQGFAPSMVNLGAACLVGKGIPRDVERAKRLVGRAAEGGDQEAMQLLAAIEQGRVSELVSDVRTYVSNGRANGSVEVLNSVSSSGLGDPQHAASRAGRGLSPTGTSLPWRPMRISAMPVLGTPCTEEKQDVLPNVDDLDELDDVPDTTTEDQFSDVSPAPSAEKAAAKAPKPFNSTQHRGQQLPANKAAVHSNKHRKAGSNSNAQAATHAQKASPQPPVSEVGRNEATAAAVLSQQFSLVDEVLFNSSSRAGAKGILEPDVRQVAIASTCRSGGSAIPGAQQQVVGTLPGQRSETELDDAVRELVQRLDTDDPADQQGAREVPGREEDGRAVAFDAEALAEAAKRGHPRAQYWLAQCLLSRNSATSDTKTIDHDASEAIQWLRAAAENGHGLAACQLGTFYQDGRALVGTVPFHSPQAGPQPKTWSRGAIGHKDPDQAAKWLEIGARSTDSPAAAWRLAQLLMTRAVSKHDADAGRRGEIWAERAAKQGVAPAAIALARAYLGGADGAAYTSVSENCQDCRKVFFVRRPVPGIAVDYAKSRQWANKVPGAHDLANFAARMALYSPGPETVGKKHYQSSSGGSDDFASTHGKRSHIKSSGASIVAQNGQSPNSGTQSDQVVAGASTVASASSPNTTGAAKRRRRRQRAKMQQQQQDNGGVAAEGHEGDGESPDLTNASEVSTVDQLFGFGDDAAIQPGESLAQILQKHKIRKAETQQPASNHSPVVDPFADDIDQDEHDFKGHESPDRLEVALAAAAAAGAGAAAPRRASLRSAWRLRRQRETTAAAKTAAAAAAKRTLAHRKRDAAGKRLQESDDFLEDTSAIQAAEAATAELLRELDTDAQAQEKRPANQRRRPSKQQSGHHKRQHSPTLPPEHTEDSPRHADGEHVRDGGTELARRVSPMSMATSDDETDEQQRRKEDGELNDDESDDESLELLSSLVAPRSIHVDRQRGSSLSKTRAAPTRGTILAPDSSSSAIPENSQHYHGDERPESPAAEGIGPVDDEDQGEWQTTIRQRRREKRKALHTVPAKPASPDRGGAPSLVPGASPSTVESDALADIPDNTNVLEEAPTMFDNDAVPALREEDADHTADDDASTAVSAGAIQTTTDDNVNRHEVHAFVESEVATESAQEAQRIDFAPDAEVCDSREGGGDDSHAIVSAEAELIDETVPKKPTGSPAETGTAVVRECASDIGLVEEHVTEFGDVDDLGAEETKEDAIFDEEYDDENMLDVKDLDARAAAAAATEAENDALAREFARKLESNEFVGDAVDDGDWIPAPNKRSRRRKAAAAAAAAGKR